MEQENKVQEFIGKVMETVKGKELDLSSDEDLSIGIMNLISIEEHLFFSYKKTGKDDYLNLLREVREIRKSLLKKIIKEYEGEVWCISKHLLASSMRLMEVGTKMLGKGNQAEAKEMFDKAYNLYSLFWGLNLGVTKVTDIKEEESLDEEKKVILVSEENTPSEKSSESLFGKLGKLVQKVLDCCKE